jgi:hypothetical protein
MQGHRPPYDLGVSWGFPGFRIGRSQYGTWWISVGLPFGFRVTRRLTWNTREEPVSKLGSEVLQRSVPLPTEATPISPELSHGRETTNQEILRKIRDLRK